MLTLEKFEEASEIVQRVIQKTKLVYSDYFSNQTGNKIYFKPENMQLTGAYKLRGAYYKISTLSEEERKRTDHCVCRKSCTGSGLCGEMLRCEGSHCDADHHSAD